MHPILTREQLYCDYEVDMAERCNLNQALEPFGSWLAEKYIIQIMNHLYLEAKKGY